MSVLSERPSLLSILQNRAEAARLPVDPDFLQAQHGTIAWLLDRLSKSTAGVRGLVAAEWNVAAVSLADGERAPQLNLAVCALIAQAYANYFLECAPERRSAFVGFDGRFLSREFAEIFTRVFAGNGLRVYRDRNEEPTPTPVTSFMAAARQLGGAIMITASHNPPHFNGIKSSTWYGGVDTDDISDQIAAHVRKLTAGGAEIRFAALPSEHVEEIDAKGMYGREYLAPTFEGDPLAQLRQAVESGAGFLFDGLFGVGAVAMERYLDILLPETDWRRSVHLLNATPDPRIGGIAKPDPSDPSTLEKSGAIRFLLGHPDTLLSVTADMDADRIGTAVIIRGDAVAEAVRYGLFVSRFKGEQGEVCLVRFTPNQIFTLITYDRMLAAFSQRLGTRDPAEIRRRLAAGEGDASRIHLITSIATSVISEELATTYGLGFHLVPVGFKNLGRLAYDIDRRDGGDVILALMEESGGAQIGPFRPWSERGDTIHRDKDTCALALALFALAGRLRAEGRNLVDFYLDMARQFGSLAYFERIDAYLPNRPTAENPATAAEADAAKAEVLRRLVALQQDENSGDLLRLFGLEASGATGPESTTLEEVSILVRQSDGWGTIHPTAFQYQLAEGGTLAWYRAGQADHDGMKIIRRDAEGRIMFWCLVRASGTEAVLRAYMEVVEPMDNPQSEHLVSTFAPLLGFLGLNTYTLEAGGESYLAAYEATIRSKYQ